MKTLQSVHFGELKYDEKDTIHLPDGLIGLSEMKDWILLDGDDDIPLKWLHSLDRPDFCLPVTDPGYFTSDYTVRVPAAYLDLLGSESEQTIAVMVITTIHPQGSSITGNLLAPLLIDTETRRGTQLPLDDEGLSLRQEIDYLKFGLAVSTESADNEETEVTEVQSERTEAAPAERHKVSV